MRRFLRAHVVTRSVVFLRKREENTQGEREREFAIQSVTFARHKYYNDDGEDEKVEEEERRRKKKKMNEEEDEESREGERSSFHLSPRF